jgi:hypothetical protein
MSSVEALAYEQSRRAIEQQAAVLSELRSRTGAMLAAASLTASFLAAQAVERSGLRLLHKRPRPKFRCGEVPTACFRGGQISPAWPSKAPRLP